MVFVMCLCACSQCRCLAGQFDEIDVCGNMSVTNGLCNALVHMLFA